MAVEIAPKLFKNNKISHLYQECRPRYTDSGLIEKILNFMQASGEPPYGRAADIGCGTGLSTQPLIPHFNDIVGLDPSRSQIEEAARCNKAEHVEFCIGSAEDLSRFPDASLDLLSVGTAIHYFEIEDFFKELQRVLKPGGTFAQFGYNHRYTSPEIVGLSIVGYDDHPSLCEVSKECNQIFREIFQTLLSEDGYQPAMVREVHGVDPPRRYIDQERHSSELLHPCNLATLVGLLQSLGVWQNYCKKSGADSEEMANRYKERFLRVLRRISEEPQEVHMKQHVTFYIVLARQPLSLSGRNLAILGEERDRNESEVF